VVYNFSQPRLFPHAHVADGGFADPEFDRFPRVAAADRHEANAANDVKVVLATVHFYERVLTDEFALARVFKIFHQHCRERRGGSAIVASPVTAGHVIELPAASST
jgi:hypothetical protein